jgi:hypothetical protein
VLFSRASTTVSFGGMAQRNLDDSRVMFDMCRVEAASGAMVASSAGLTKFMRILTVKMGWRFYGSDDFCGVYIRCSLRVC